MSFSAWITILTPKTADIIVSRLVAKGYAISMLFDSNVLVSGGKDNLSFVLGLRLTGDASATAADVRESIFSVLNAEKLKCYSVVVVATDGSSSCSPGNLTRADLKAAKPTLAVVTPLPPGPYRKDDGIIDDTKPTEEQ